ncbi:hypothetical protein GT360_20535 [Vibrio astriarenae]|uniref:Uncharacterized protein n=1 Tax=Vibrio astriarenae TaxID=1481923 RepID=A0A7Z2T7V8_9VIBR|nr:hypothetical protein [Vibrio astriarenae]QIA65895.1 hypothetical protein GT360_20535 [Vibrio astriarenae]
MPTAYCSCCRKETAHKVVMRRSEEELPTMSHCLRVVKAVFTGDHYMKMEKVVSCRVCATEFKPAVVVDSGLSPA